MATNQSVPSGHQSWRSSRRQVASSPTSTAPLRWFLLSVVLVLLAGFVGLIYWLCQPTPRTQLITLRTGETDLLLPSILFEQATLKSLKGLSERNISLDYEEIPLGYEEESVKDFQSILDRLQDIQVNPEESLVVYVSAHGVSMDGKAYLLAPSFDVRVPEQHRYPVDALIDAIDKLDAATKLLVLDCSRLGVLPRAGMLLNEFSWLVEEKAKKLDDPNFWILTAAGGLETSPLGLAAGWSFLGGALAEALAGQADHAENDGDGKVSLAELEQHVQTATRQNGMATPNPRLISCGNQDRSRNLEKHILVRVPPQSDPEQEAEGENEAAASTATASSAEPEPSAIDSDSTPKSSAKQPPDKQAVENPAKDTVAGTPEDAPAPESAANKKPAPATEDPENSQSPILQAWQQRDDLEQRPRIDSRTGKAINPIDYAPLLWTELNAELLALHLKQCDQPDTDINTIFSKLEQLKDAPSGRNGDGWSAIEGDSWSAMPTDYKNKYREYKTALLDFRYYFYRAGQYVRWHRAAHCATRRVPTATTTSIEQLLESLEQFDAVYRKLSGKKFDRWSDTNVLLNRINAVRKMAYQLDEKMAFQLDDVMTEDIESKDDPIRQRKLEVYLATDLVTAGQRKRLLDLLPALASAATGNKTVPLSGIEPDWEAAFRHAGLECRLAKIVNPDLELNFNPFVDSIEDVMKRTSNSDKERRAWFRDLGNILHDFYNSEVANIRQQETYMAEKMVVILHPRDATSGSNAGHFVKNRIGLPGEYTLIPPGQTVLTQIDNWEPVTWELNIANISASSPEMWLHFDDKLLMMRYEGQLVTSGESIRLPQSDLLRFQVQALHDAPGSRQARTVEIALNVSMDSTKRLNNETAANKTAVAQVILPSLDRIDLFASCVDPQIDEESIGEEGIRLQPFPNRGTEFQFELMNRSDMKKNLRVELIAVRPLQVNKPPGRLLDIDDKPFAPLVRWARDAQKPFAEAEFILPADGSHHKIVFSPPGEGARETAPAKEDETAKEKDQKKEPVFKQVDVTHGILCRLIDVSKNDEDARKVWDKWIEIVPRRPNHYLDVGAQLVRSGNVREVRLTVQPKDLNQDGQRDLPPSMNDLPVPLILQSAKILGTKVPVNAEISDSSVVTMSVTLPQDMQGTASLELSVDDFPRALVWQVNRDRDDGPIAPDEDHPSLSIDWVSMAGAPDSKIPERMFFRKDAISVIPESVDPQNIHDVDLQRDPQASLAFNVTRQARPLRMGLRVDARPDDFHGVHDDVVVVDGVSQQTQRLYCDRRIVTEIVEITETGGLKIKSSVSDHMLTLEPPGVSNKKLKLAAKLILEGDPAAEDYVSVVFDSRPPIVHNLGFPGQVTTGRPFNISPSIEDQSDISLVEVWLSDKEIDPDKLDKPAAQPFGEEWLRPFRPSDDGWWKPTLQLKALEEAKTYYTYLRVTDGSGQFSGKSGLMLEVKLPNKPPPPKPPGPLVADLHGQMWLGTEVAPKGLRVYLKEKANKEAETVANGAFVIKQVEAGSYTLVVEDYHTAPVIGEQKIDLVREEDFKGVVVKAKFDR